MADKGAALERESAKLAERGKIIEQRILEIDTLLIGHPDPPCDPNNFATAEAFEECLRGYFDGGRGAEQLAPPPSSPYDLDPSVVKPNWD